jgi:hypothetical protein
VAISSIGVSRLATGIICSCCNTYLLLLFIEFWNVGAGEMGCDCDCDCDFDCDFDFDFDFD